MKIFDHIKKMSYYKRERLIKAIIITIILILAYICGTPENLKSILKPPPDATAPPALITPATGIYKTNHPQDRYAADEYIDYDD